MNQAKYEVYVLGKTGKMLLQHASNDFDSALACLKRWDDFQVTRVEMRITRSLPEGE